MAATPECCARMAWMSPGCVDTAWTDPATEAAMGVDGGDPFLECRSSDGKTSRAGRHNN